MDGKLRTLLADVLQVPESAVADDLTMQNLEAWDSLRHMELIAAVEQTFAVELTFDEIVAMKTVAHIRRVLREHGLAA